MLSGDSGDFGACRGTRPRGYIVNTDRAAGPGTHWTALWLTAGPLALYYDPVGYPPPHAIYEGLRRAGYKTIYSTTKSQRGGDNCGARSAIALEMLAGAADAERTFRTILAA